MTRVPEVVLVCPAQQEGRAAAIAAALAGEGLATKVTPLRRGVHRPGRQTAGGAPIVHAFGLVALLRALLLGRRASAIIYDLVPPSRLPISRLERRAASRCEAVVARSDELASDAWRRLQLPTLPVVVEELQEDAGNGASLTPESRDRLIGLCQRLPAAKPSCSGRQRVPPARTSRELLEALRSARREGGLLTAMLRLWGRYLRIAGRPARAIPLLQGAVSRGAGPKTHIELGHALRQAGRQREAATVLRGIAQVADGDPDVAVDAAIELSRIGDRRPAIELIEAIGPLDGSSTAAEHARVARLSAALDRPTQAVAAASTATSLAPHARTLRTLESRVLEHAGAPSLALKAARAAGDTGRIRRLEGLLRIHDPRWLPAAKPGATDAPDRGAILHLLESSLPHARAGYGYRTRAVLAAEQRAGFRPVAATRLGFPANRHVRRFSLVETVDGIVHHRLVLPGRSEYSGIPLDELLTANLELLIGLCRTVHPAALAAASPHINGLLGLALREATGLPLIYEVRGFPEMTWAARYDDATSDAELYGLRRGAETRCMREADAVVVLSETMRREVASRGVPRNRIHALPHLVDVELFSPGPPDHDLLRRYGLEGRTVVGYIGSIVDYEGLDVLLLALARAREEDQALACLVVGDGPGRPGLERLAEELGLGGSAVFTGRVPHSRIADHYRLLDIAVCPRRDLEVCRSVTPLKPYEALATGRCLVVSDLPALAEMTGGQAAGRTFRPGDDADLARVLVELAGDAARRDALGMTGRELAVEQHSQDAGAVLVGAALAPVLEGAGAGVGGR